MARQNRVFICYATEDMHRVQAIADEMATRSIATWFDQNDMSTREDPDIAIPPAIEQCRFFAIFLSRFAIPKIGPRPGFQKKELDQAYQIAVNQPLDDFTIIPLRLEDCDDGGLGDLVQFDLYPSAETEATLDRLAALVVGSSERGSIGVVELIATATALLGAGDIDRAQEAIDRILAEFPHSHDALHLKACVLESRGEYDAAIASYTEAIESHPGFALGYTNRGNAYAAIGEHGKAAADIDKSIALNPNRPAPYNNRGIERRRSGDLEGALADYDRAISLAPSYAGAMVNRAILFDQQGDMEKARADLDRAIKLDPHHVHAHFILGQLQHQNRELAEALATFSRLIEIDPRFREAYFHRAMVLEDRSGPGDYDSALADYDRSIGIEPTGNALFNRAHVLNRMSRTLDAIAAFGDVLAFDPTDDDARTFLLQTHQVHSALVAAAAGDRSKLDKLVLDPERVLRACEEALARGDEQTAGRRMRRFRS